MAATKKRYTFAPSAMTNDNLIINDMTRIISTLTLGKASYTYTSGVRFKYGKKRGLYEYVATVYDETDFGRHTVIVAYDFANRQYTAILASGENANTVCYTVD